MIKPILLVDDDPALCALLSEYLTAEGFAPEVAHSGQQALALWPRTPPFEAIVLDIMMPGMSGLELLQQWRQQNIITPIIMLTGRGDDIDRIVGLEMGADDYLGKPCNPRELAARLRAVIRRTSPRVNGPEGMPAQLSVQGIVLNAAAFEASCNGLPLKLTAAEFNVLQVFLMNVGCVLNKAQLTQQALSRDYSRYDRSIDVHVSRIRQKLAACGMAEDIIRAVRGQGYQLLRLDPGALHSC